MAERIFREYYVAGGRPDGVPYKRSPLHDKDGPRMRVELCIVANFVEVFLARENHDNSVGINYLEKIQIPHLPSLYGAMLAGVDYVLMGAGIPVKIPGVLDSFVRHQSASYPLHVTGAMDGDETRVAFDPAEFVTEKLPALKRPHFLAIIASNVLAAAILKKANGRVDGFVIEGHTAGGHNAPPRGKLQLDDQGEVVYGERDHVDLDKIRQLELPFWLAGGYGSPDKLREAFRVWAPPEFRWERHSRSVRSPACETITNRNYRKGRRFRSGYDDESLRFPNWFPFQGGSTGRHAF